jgi:hypothetical protein
MIARTGEEKMARKILNKVLIRAFVINTTSEKRWLKRS